MYTDVLLTQDEALCHLFLHCCFRDGRMTGSEIDALAARFTKFGLQKQMNFKEEVIKYKSYGAEITDEKEYLSYLVTKIHPTNELALYSYCLELTLSDSKLDVTEESLLKNIADVLNISESYQEAIQALMVQRSVVEDEKYF